MGLQVIGHRGARRLAIENSLQSLQIALAEGADGVECDVQLSSDGELLVFHDDDLQRLCHRPERVTQLPWKVLRALRAEDGDLAPQPIAHLDQVLELAAMGNKTWNFELKVDRTGQGNGLLLAEKFERHTANLARQNWLVSSFDKEPLQRLTQHRAQLRLAALIDERQPSAWWHLLGQTAAELAAQPSRRRQEPVEFQMDAELPPVDVPLYACNPYHAHVTVARAALWRARGWQIWPWTVNDPRRWEYLVQQPIEAIVTDEPLGLLKFLSANRLR